MLEKPPSIDPLLTDVGLPNNMNGEDRSAFWIRKATATPSRSTAILIFHGSTGPGKTTSTWVRCTERAPASCPRSGAVRKERERADGGKLDPEIREVRRSNGDYDLRSFRFMVRSDYPRRLGNTLYGR